MSDTPDVLVVPTGTANIASVIAAFERAGATVAIAPDADAVRRATHVVLPGVGAFGAAMQRIREDGVADALAERIHAGRATLAVCVGFQLLFEESEESPGVTGLGVLPGKVLRFPTSVRVPQIGWKRIEPDAACRMIARECAYFANSYCATQAPPDWAAARADHGGFFVAAVERGAVLGCQFHPELSGAWGQALIARWLGRAGREMGTPQLRLAPRIIPCLDVSHGRVVKGIKFQGLRDAGDPAELGALYESQDADELIVLDVSATPEARGTQVETVRRVRACLSIPLTVGGGVRSAENAQALLEAGADKVSANTAAVERPDLIGEIAGRFGSQCMVIAIDAARRAEGGFEVVIHSGRERTGRDAVEWAREATGKGAGEILLTSWDRDGTRSGYDLELIGAVADAVNVPIIGSGGAADASHLHAAVEAGADAVLAASIFHDREYTVGEIKQDLVGLGIEARL